MKDVANEMDDMSNQVVELYRLSPNTLKIDIDKEYKQMWIALRNSLLDLELNNRGETISTKEDKR